MPVWHLLENNLTDKMFDRKWLFFGSAIFITMILACAAPEGWDKPIGSVTSIPTATSTSTPTPTSTQTPTITPTPGPDLSWAPVQNGMYADPTKYQDVIQNYYIRSPDAFHGYATRYGPDSMAEEVLWTHVVEMLDQLDHTDRRFSYMGGGAGYQLFSHDEDPLLLDNRASEAWARIVKGETPLNWICVGDTGICYSYKGNQDRILSLFGRDPDEILASSRDTKLIDLVDKDRFFANFHALYVGAIALKSPNDFGAAYCLYGGIPPYKKIGRVLVGDFAAQQDWTPFDPAEIGEPRVHLGQRIYFADDGSEWEWAADLPDSMFNQLSVNHAALMMLLPVEICDE